MPFVLDSSVALAYLLNEPEAARFRLSERLTADSAISPRIWWFEVRNVLLVGERRNRLLPGIVDLLLEQVLPGLAVELDHEPDDRGAFELSRRHKLTFYDATYVELAMRRGIGLATLDREIVVAAQKEGVPLLGVQ